MSSSFLKLRKHGDGPVIVTPSIYGGEQINTLTLLEGNQQKKRKKMPRMVDFPSQGIASRSSSWYFGFKLQSLQLKLIATK